jgi:hypothetical protein
MKKYDIVYADVMPSFLARIDFTRFSNDELLEIAKIVKPYSGRYEIIQSKKSVLYFKLPFIGEEYKLIIKPSIQGLYHIKSPDWYKEFQPSWVLFNSFKLWQYLSAKYTVVNNTEYENSTIYNIWKNKASTNKSSTKQ